MKQIVSILSGRTTQARSAPASLADAQAKHMAQLLDNERAENGRLAARVATETARCTKLETAILRKEDERTKAEARASALQAQLLAKTEEHQALRIEEARLREQLGAAMDARDEAQRTRTSAERAMQAVLERRPEVTVVERDAGATAAPTAPVAYELDVVGRDGNNLMRKMILRPVKDKG